VFELQPFFSSRELQKRALINMRSVCNKFREWYHFLYTSVYDAVLLTETWLQGDIPNSLLDPECKYNIFRCDRPTMVFISIFFGRC